MHLFPAPRPHLTPSVPALLPALAVPLDLGTSCIRSHSRTAVIPLTLGGLNIIPLIPSTPLCVPGGTGLHLCPPVPRFPQQRGHWQLPTGRGWSWELCPCGHTQSTQHHRPSLLPTTRCGQQKMQIQKLLQTLFPSQIRLSNGSKPKIKCNLMKSRVMSSNPRELRLSWHRRKPRISFPKVLWAWARSWCSVFNVYKICKGFKLLWDTDSKSH